MAQRLLHSTSLVSFNTFISRISGFLRDMVFAHYFGAIGGFDAYVVATKLPSFMRRLFAEGAFSQAFVPVLAEYRRNQTHQDVRNFIGHVSGSLSAILLVVVLLSMILAPLLITIFAPGFSHEGIRFALAAGMLRITFPYLLFISLTAVGSAVLNTYDSFGIPAFTPVLQNLTLIFAAIFIAPLFSVSIYALAWGIFFAGIFQFIFQWPFLCGKRLLVFPKIGFQDPGVKRVLKLMGPAVFGVSVAQVGVLFDTIFASFLKTGSVSWLYYSDRLINFPLGVFGVAIATVILPKLSSYHAEKDSISYSKTLDWALRLLLLVGIPSAVGLFILSGPLLSTLFQGGRFTQMDVLMARKSLIAFAVGIQAFMLIKVLASGFYARQEIKKPVKLAAFAVLINIGLNFIFISPLAHAGLALSTSLAACINAGTLFFLLLRKNIYAPQAGWRRYFLQLIFSNFVMGFFLFFTSGQIEVWFHHTRIERVGHLSWVVLGAVLIYFGCLFCSGVRVKDFRLN